MTNFSIDNEVGNSMCWADTDIAESNKQTNKHAVCTETLL